LLKRGLKKTPITVGVVFGVKKWGTVLNPKDGWAPKQSIANKTKKKKKVITKPKGSPPPGPVGLLG